MMLPQHELLFIRNLIQHAWKEQDIWLISSCQLPAVEQGTFMKDLMNRHQIPSAWSW